MKNNITAFHSLSSAPFFNRGGLTFKMTAEDLYSAVLSSLLWRKNNGKVFLYCDNPAFEFIKKTELLSVWDNVLVTIPCDLEGIDANMFWAAGKLFALREHSTPCVMMDTDFIVWCDIEPYIKETEVTATHREELDPGIYPPLDTFKTPENSLIRKEFLEYKNTLPCNTAFLYFKNEGFKNFYLASAFDFIKHSPQGGDFLTYMVTAEQRLLAICADYLKIPINTLLSKEELFLPQNNFTHLWGAKSVMRGDSEKRFQFYTKCKNRIINDFPQFKFIIKKIEEFEY